MYASLQEAKAQGEKVMCFSHLPVCPSTCPPACLLWNYEEVLHVGGAEGGVQLVL